MEDRRIFIRLKAKFPLLFLSSDKEIEGEAETIDISANGVGIITDEKLPPNTPLEMWLQIPDNHQPLYVKGEVVWTQTLSEEEKQRVGIRLEKENLMGFARAYRI